MVATLLELVGRRGTHPAFDGEFTVSTDPAGDGVLVLAWRNGDASAELRADLAAGSWRATFRGPDGAAEFDGDGDGDGDGDARVR